MTDNKENKECWLVFLHCCLCRGKEIGEEEGRAPISNPRGWAWRERTREGLSAPGPETQGGLRTQFALRPPQHHRPWWKWSLHPTQRPGVQDARREETGAQEERPAPCRGPHANGSATSQDASLATQNRCVPKAWGGFSPFIQAACETPSPTSPEHVEFCGSQD